MKKILGLDLGTTSIGWALVDEAENENEQSRIIDLGVRVNPLTTDEQQNFEKGKSQSVNAQRTLARGARRNLQRYKLRRKNLIEILKQNNIITNDSVLCEEGKNSTHSTLKLRAKAANEKISKEDFAKVLLAINKKRGYKSSRKAQNDEEGQLIDGMSVAIELKEKNLTPGQYCFNLLNNDKNKFPDFYKSDLQNEFQTIWDFQQQFYPEILDDELWKKLQNKSETNSSKIFLGAKKLYTADNKGKEKTLTEYQWRNDAVNTQLPIDQVAYTLCKINGKINGSSDYLGAISDRSKKIFFNKETIGEYLYRQIQENPHNSLKNQVFYRQDYINEFEKIWDTQAKYHSELTPQLKEEIRDVIIFYQRRLKSQKGLIDICEFENKTVTFKVDGKTKTKIKGLRVCPKSSPLFQEFKIWQNIGNIVLLNKEENKKYPIFESFDSDELHSLFQELNWKGNLKKADVLKLLVKKPKEWDLNYSEIQGNTTNQRLLSVYISIAEEAGYPINSKKQSAAEIIEALSDIFTDLGIDKSILYFNSDLPDSDNQFQGQKSFKLWHLLYSYEGDNSNVGNESLFTILEKEFGFNREFAQALINVKFEKDYGNLSAKAIRKILPHLREHRYSDACLLAGYNHSHSVTKEENEKRELKDRLELLPKNSLRNPVVEKILNQMINVINAIIDNKDLGKPDEIRIELARELKKNAKEREDASKSIEQNKKLNDEIRETIQKKFNIPNPSRNDIIRYKLYEELKPNGYKGLYSNEYISPEQVFSGDVDIEHIIPKARIFDDSFSNKTLEYKSVNLKKGDMTAYDFVEQEYGEKYLEEYVNRVKKYFSKDKKAKCQKLLKRQEDIEDNFIERDLRESQYIAKKAKEILLELCKTVVSTSGSITAKLREDWELINTMKELNIDKYRELGLTSIEERRNGDKVENIIDWTKRNDHRHHAMDALTVAFTTHNHIQYLNNLNARKNESCKKHKNIIAIENKITHTNSKGKRIFNAPMPHFRTEAKKALENILISHKAKNKVVTRNKNKIKKGVEQNTLTPRAQLHKETVYGISKYYQSKEIKIGTGTNKEIIEMVSVPSYKEALLKRLEQFDNNPKKAFGGKNSLAKNPILTSEGAELPEKIKITWLENRYTIRKNIDKDLKVDKVVDKQIQKILKQRLAEYNNSPKEAFADIVNKPIWLDKDKNISIKRVSITGVSNAEPLHYKRDNYGNLILNSKGQPIPSDYVSLGNNHHIAIYKDENGDFQEEIVSFYQAIARVNEGLPIVNKNHEKGWEFMFTLKKNEMFIFPNDDFDPTEIDLLNPKNRAIISPHLFRVQKITTKDYIFNHHLETQAVNNDKLKIRSLHNNKFYRIQTPQNLKNIIKVRINHLGHIVQVGEY